MHPDVQRNLRDEIRATRVKVNARGDKQLLISDLESMKYNVSVIKVSFPSTSPMGWSSTTHLRKRYVFTLLWCRSLGRQLRMMWSLLCTLNALFQARWLLPSLWAKAKELSCLFVSTTGKSNDFFDNRFYWHNRVQPQECMGRRRRTMETWAVFWTSPQWQRKQGQFGCFWKLVGPKKKVIFHCGSSMWGSLRATFSSGLHSCIGYAECLHWPIIWLTRMRSNPRWRFAWVLLFRSGVGFNWPLSMG